MSDAFVSLDAEWRFTYLNPQAEVLVGRDRRELVGKSLWEEYPEMVDSTLDIECRRAITEQVPVRCEIFMQRFDRTFEVRAYPVVAGLAVYFRDVSGERLRDDRLRQTERLEMLGQITAGIVHDFTNLLAATGGFAAMGEADASDEKIARYFHGITSANKKAEALTRQLLAFARQQELSPGIMDANEVIHELSTLLYQLMPPDVELRFTLASEGVKVFVDRSKLEQVVLNLVVNSRDAIQGTGSITIKTAVEDPTGIEHDLDGPFG
ncbi:MAG: PAS domain-containing protein, partial [Actinobacteria bacterium]|nr:PAS domain-containing protein [Actinomycetota bacterium]